jgi:hypothetical protein
MSFIDMIFSLHAIVHYFIDIETAFHDEPLLYWYTEGISLNAE